MIAIGAKAVRSLVPMADAIAVVRSGFAALSRGLVLQPQRLQLQDGSTLVMAARRSDGGGAVSENDCLFRPDNIKRHLPTLDGAALWFSDETGTPEAVIAATALTALRTGAASGVATDLLARRDACVLAMLGAGAQAPDQIRAVCCIRPITRVQIHNRTTTKAALLQSHMKAEFPNIDFEVATTVAEALQGSDVVCCATSASEPLFRIEDVPPNVHVNAIGAYRLDMCELPAELFAAPTVVCVDHIPAALAEAGDIVGAVSAGTLELERLEELGRLLSSWPGSAGRGPVRTIFKSVGVAAQDLALADLLVGGHATTQTYRDSVWSETDAI